MIQEKKTNENNINLKYIFTHFDLKNIINKTLINSDQNNPDLKISITDINDKKNIDYNDYQTWMAICKFPLPERNIEINDEIILTKKLIYSLDLQLNISSQTFSFGLSNKNELNIFLIKEKFSQVNNQKQIDYETIIIKIGSFENGTNNFISDGPNEPRIAFNDDKEWLDEMEKLDKLIISKNILIPIYNSHQTILNNYKKEKIQEKRLTESYFHYRLYDNHVVNSNWIPYHFFIIISSTPDDKGNREKYYLVHLKYDMSSAYVGDAILSFNENGTELVKKGLVFAKLSYEHIEYKKLSSNLQKRMEQNLNSVEYMVKYIPVIDITQKTLDV